MGLPDTHDVMEQCDRWLVRGAPPAIPPLLHEAIQEQGWKPEEFLPELCARWIEYMTRSTMRTEAAAFHHGYGWRVWYPDGTECHSLTHLWKDLPNGIVGGVVYCGLMRRILAGRDPFCLEDGLPRMRPHHGLSNSKPYESLQVKEGVWVTDAQMADFRKQAIFAFGLEG